MHSVLCLMEYLLENFFNIENDPFHAALSSFYGEDIHSIRCCSNACQVSVQKQKPLGPGADPGGQVAMAPKTAMFPIANHGSEELLTQKGTPQSLALDPPLPR